MANNTYSSSYPQIVIDEQVNYPNANTLIYKLTAEQFQDIMHHTHKISDLIGGDGAVISAGEVSKEDFNTLKSSVEQLKNTLQALQNSITEPTNIQDIINRISNIESAITVMDNKIDVLEENAGTSGGTSVNSLVDRVTALESYVGNTSASESTSSLNDRVTALENNSDDGFIIDYNPDIPGTQDINGNTIDG